MRHIAFEGPCWVLNCGTALHTTMIPPSFPARDRFFGDQWPRNGDSAIINPTGTIGAGPLHRAYGILYAECPPDPITAMRRRLDVAGHYGRPDVFRFELNPTRPQPITFVNARNLGFPGSTNVIPPEDVGQS